MSRLIDADEFLRKTRFQPGRYPHKDIKLEIDALPTVDAVEVVRCQYCVLHGNCYMEDAFAFAGAPNPFCCAGKRRTDG